jgi:hypothetical protein
MTAPAPAAPVKPCPNCDRTRDYDRCSRVECPRRKPKMFDPEWDYTAERLADSCYHIRPTNKE